MLILISSYIADLVFGDPEWFPHPIRAIGALITALEKKLRRNRAKWIERTKGATFAILVMGIVFLAVLLTFELLRKIDPLFGNLFLVYLGYTTLSIKDLRVKAKAIMKEIKTNSIVAARRELSKIVGRDTQNLSKEEIARAAVESIAENTNDGIIAPLFYLILGGPILAIVYKAVNTLDSMVGYKNEKYIHFGWFSAKLDDLINFIPARITGVLIGIASSAAYGSPLAMTRSLKSMLRDGRKHPSPNSGIPEAAMAGALGVRLGGPSFYWGRRSDKPYIGEASHAPDASHITRALAISGTASFLMVLLGVIFKWVI